MNILKTFDFLCVCNIYYKTCFVVNETHIRIILTRVYEMYRNTYKK